MSDISPNLSLPYLMPSQAQKHVTHNEALQRLDCLTQLVVQGLSETVPPALPEEGDTVVLGPGATSGWAGHAGEIACFTAGSWQFIAPREGWRAFDRATGRLHVYDTGSWRPVEAATQALDGIGIGATWDSVNRLSVSSEAVLLNHSGAGHQLKVNKAATAETASLLFQNNWTGHAEMGLAGSNDFSVKVSDDGSSWITGLAINASTGHVGLGTTAPQEVLHAVSTGTPALRVESDGYGTAELVAKGRRNGANTDIARLRFINQEDTAGSDASEAAIIASRKGDIGDIQLSFQVSDAGTPVEAFSVTPTGSLTSLSIYSTNDHITLKTFGPDSARLVANRSLTLAADPTNSEGGVRSEILFETDGLQRAVVSATGHLGVGITAPKRRAHIAEAMRLEPASEPAMPGAGDIYFDATTLKLRCHDGTQWHDLF